MLLPGVGLHEPGDGARRLPAITALLGERAEGLAVLLGQRDNVVEQNFQATARFQQNFHIVALHFFEIAALE